MARIWKIVRHDAPDEWEDSIPEKSLSDGQLVRLLSRLAASHVPPATTPLPRHAPRYTTSLIVKNDRWGNKRFTMYASGSRVHYIATLEEAPVNAQEMDAVAPKPGPRGPYKKRTAKNSN